MAQTTSLTILPSPVRAAARGPAPVGGIDPARLPREVVDALYIHVPFCFHKCHYCDFYSITRQTPARMEQYVDLLLREAELWTDASAGPISRAKTIFIGGGTPTLLPADAMRRLLVGLRERFDLSAVTEWTVEANPATVTLDYCRLLREAGVNRLSFGAQSFDRAELALLERHHDPDDIARSIDLARQAGFDRLNVDLIYAIPGQSLASWAKSLALAIRLGTSHVSCYNLTFEPNTALAVRKRLGEFAATEESLELAMFLLAREHLQQAGLSAYEISNYAVPGQACRHNLLYWTGGSYIGLGPSAASHVAGWRWKNRPHLGEWERAVKAGAIPAAEVEHLSAERRAGELAMLMLRLSRGVTYSDFAARTGLDARTAYADQLRRYIPAGLLGADENAIWLTESGLRVADALSAEFLQIA